MDNMSAVAGFFASILLFLQGIFSAGGGYASAAPASLPVDPHAQVAAAATQFLPVSAPAPEALPVPVSPPSPIVQPAPANNTYVTQPVIERVVQQPVAGSVSEQSLSARLTSLKDDLLMRIAAVASAPIVFSGPAPSTPISTASFAPSQRIDSLTNTSINTPTITGGSISGATVSGTLSGTFSGTISGATSFTEATTTSFAISSIPWGLLSTDGLGNIVATSTPTAAAFVATSAAATSTFAGGFIIGGNVGIGTTSPAATLSVAGNGYFTGGLGVGVVNTGGIYAAQAMSSGSLSTPGVLMGKTGSYAGTEMYNTAGTLMDFSATSGRDYDFRQIFTAATNDYIFSASTTANILVLKGSGNVGIGTTTPGALLSANGNILGAGTLTLTGTTGTTTIASGQGFTVGGSQFVLQQGSGNVGLGTAAPSATLDLRGTFSATTTGDDMRVAFVPPTFGGLWETNHQITSSYSSTHPRTRSTLNVSRLATGSGENGPGHSNIGAFITSEKTDYLTSTIEGEVDALYLIAAQGNKGDASGASIGVSKVRGGSSPTGGALGIEASTRWIDQSSNVLMDVHSLVGFAEGAGGQSGDTGYGFYAESQGATNATSSNQVQPFTAYYGGHYDANGNCPGACPIFTNLLVGAGSRSAGDIYFKITGGQSLAGDIVVGADNATAPDGAATQSAGTQWTMKNVGGDWRLYGNDGATVLQTIKQTGSVGIGTTSPSSRLHISGSSPSITLDTTAATKRTSILFNAGSVSQFQLGTDLNLDGSRNFFLYDVASTATRLLIDSSGNVGIGTTTPTSKLSVVGNIYAEQTGAAVGYTGNRTDGTAFSLQAAATVSRFNFADTGDFAISNNTRDNILNNTTAAAGLDFLVAQSSTGNLLLNSEATGNVGIGTTSPVAKLGIQGALGVNTSQLYLAADGRVGINQTAPQSTFEVWGDANVFATTTPTTAATARQLTVGEATNNAAYRLALGYFNDSGTYKGVVQATNGGSGTSLLLNPSGGNVGIGTTTPTAQFSTTGTVRFAGLGSGGANLVTDALGNVTASSDERLKDKQGDFTRGLAAINAISPVLYKWRPETGFDTQSTYAGFFAQNVQSAIPEAVSQDSRGYLTLADRPILAALVNAVKELSQQMGDLAARVVTKELIFVRAEGDDLMLNHQLCIRDGATDPNPICLTKSQVAAVLTVIGQGGASSAASSSSASSTPDTGVVATSTPPTIQINGANPAIIHIGDTYADLGATITGPTESLNLGIATYLNGALTDAFTFYLDTATSSTSTIDYVVTDTFGQTATATRTVVVE
jgi:hypothetical protein